MGNFITNLLGGFGSGIGQTIGKITGKAADWIPSPGQYRRNKIHALTAKMLSVQRTVPFNDDLYRKLSDERSKLERESINAGQ